MDSITGCNAGGQQGTCPGPSFEAWRQQGAEMIIWCIGQEYEDYKCRMNNHLHCQDRTCLSSKINNLHD